MFGKKTLFLIVLVMVFCRTMTEVVMAYDDEDDLFVGDVSSEMLDDLAAYEKIHYADPAARRAITPDQMGDFFKLARVEQPLFQTTSVPAGRDLLYLLPHKITAVEHGGFAITYFFNMTSPMKVTVGDLINFESADKAQLKEFIQGFTLGASPQELESLLPLFKKITLQERKTGLLFQTGFIKGPLTVQLNSSIMMGERNFFLNNKDRRDIESYFPGEKFNEREFYRLRVGMGDTRLKIGLNTLNMTSFQNDIGLETIIPTSRVSYTPRLKLGLAQVAFDVDELQKSGLDALRAVRDNLLNPQLGNNGHFGLGCYHETKISMFHNLAQLWTRVSYDVLFPNEEDRLFLFKKTLLLSALNRLPNTPEGRDVITNFIRQYFCPSSFKASVYPGGVLNSVISVTTDLSKRLKFALGYDFYTQQDEFIRSIHNTNVSLNDLSVEKAQRRSVRQHKVFSELFYHKIVKKKDFGVAIGGDITAASRRIGADWTLYWKVAGSF